MKSSKICAKCGDTLFTTHNELLGLCYECEKDDENWRN